MRLKRWLWALALWASAHNLLFAQTGKISGTVIDEKGKPVEAAAVFIPSLSIGTYTAEDGSFFILNIPAGTYTLRVNYIGYQPVRVENLRVDPGKTTFIRVKLKPATIKLHEVVVRARSFELEKYATWKESRVRIRPSIQDVPADEILKSVAGFTRGSYDEWHLRGGRSDDIAFYVDGIPVTDPLRGGNAAEFNPWALNQISIFAGSFSANFGAALSGVVSATTWKPEKYGLNFAINIETPYIYGLSTESPYRRKDAFAPDAYDFLRDSSGNSLYKPPARLSSPSIKVRIGQKLKGGYWGVTLVRTTEDSYLPFGYKKTLGLEGKIGFTTGSFRLDFPFELSGKEGKSYSHRWKYRPDGYPSYRRKFGRFSLNLSGLLRDNLTLEATAGIKTGNNFRGYDEDSMPWTYSNPRTDEWAEFYIDGQAPVYRKDRYTSFYGHIKGILQVGHHELSTGVEVQKHWFHVREWERFYLFGYIGEGHMSTYDVSPRQFAVYLQDKIEYPGFFLNLGFRAEGTFPGVSFWENMESPLSRKVKVPGRVYISPRIGLAYPVTDRIVFHLSYGRFIKNPPMDALYRNLQYRDHPERMPKTLVLIGNPFLRPERTVTYEVGIKVLADPLRFDLTLFAKDVWDLLSTRHVLNFPFDYNYYYNGDFATIRGFEVDASWKLGIFSFNAGYMYQVALGNRSFPLRAFYDAYMGLPEEMMEYPLDYDRRHLLKLMVNGSLKGFDLLHLIEFASGLPYTPDLGTGVVAPPNSARMPATFDWTVKVEKKFRKGFTLSVQVFNLLNYRNVLFVHPRTGDPFYAGPSEVAWLSPDMAHNPSHVGPPRRWKIGIRWEF